MPQSPVVLKGSAFTLFVVQLHSANPDIIQQALSEKIKQAPTFFSHAPVVMNIDNLPLNADLTAIYQAMTATGVRVVGVSGCKDAEQKQKVIDAGLPLLTEGKSQEHEHDLTIDIDPPPPIVETVPTLIVDKPVRTGQQIYARNGDLVVTTDVSAGAELIADGNIYIYGALRGRALAGASGDDNCRIFCTQLAAELVSIAGQYWLSEQIPNQFFEKPAQLSIKNHDLSIKILK